MSERRSRQEIFDIAYRGLAAQGFVRSVGGAAGGCAYRGDGGLKCAIGHLIPDEKYDETFEGCTPYDRRVIAAAGIDAGDLDFCNDLQDTHDGDTEVVETPFLMKKRLAEFAATNNLTIPGEVTA